LLACVALSFALCWPGRAAPAAPVIRAISIEGSSWPYRDGLVDMLPFRPGDAWSETAGRRVEALLRATGDFKEVAVTSLVTPDGVDVSIRLEPRDMVVSVEVQGNLLLLEDEIRGVLKTRVGDPVDPERGATDRRRVEELYRRRGFFDTRVTAELRDGGRPGRKKAVLTIEEGSPGVVQRVVAEGNSVFSSEQLLGIIKILPYTYLDMDEVEESVEALLKAYRQAGYIQATVAAEVTRRDDLAIPSLSVLQPLKSFRSLLPGDYEGVDVVFRVSQGIRSEIRIEGNREVDTATIAGLTSFSESGFFDPFEVEESRERILAHYRNNGFPFVRVEVETGEAGASAGFTIDEGPRVKIVSASIVGNASVGEKTLRSLLTSVPGIFGSKLYRADDLASDATSIRAAYAGRGHQGTVVRVEEIPVPDRREQMEIRFVIEEGTVTAMGGVTFTGNTVFDENTLRKTLNLPADGIWRPVWAEEARRAIFDLYSAKGYADCRVEIRLVTEPGNAGAAVRVEIREGGLVRLGAIVVSGNYRTGHQVILREFRKLPGEPYDPLRLAESRRRMYQRGLYTRVEFVPVGGVEAGVTDLLVRVDERASVQFGVGVGYDSEEFARGFVELSDVNLLGTGRSAKARYKLSTAGYRLDLYYGEPFVFGTVRDATVNLYRQFSEEPGYDLYRTGLKLSTEVPLVRSLDLLGAYRYEDVRYDNLSLEQIDDEDAPEDQRIGSLIGRISWDDRDKPIDPHRGVFAMAGVEVALDALGSESQFVKGEAGVTVALPLARSSTLMGSVRIGLAEANGGSDDLLPHSERFFAGGAATIRGYADKTVGPLDTDGTPLGGNAMFLANLEWRFGIWKNFGGVLFVDAGNIYVTAGDVKLDDIRSSLGAGIRYATPIGPVRLEYAAKLDLREGEDSYRIHFTLGQPF
jgi:outer membrane protein insertion porin family